MEDFEKSRVEHVQQMEVRMRHLAEAHDKYKAIAEQWEPKLTVVQDSKQVTFGLEFGGKRTHATIDATYLANADAASATTAIVDALIESLVCEQIRKVVRPQLEAAQHNVKSISGAGKW